MQVSNLRLRITNRDGNNKLSHQANPYTLIVNPMIKSQKYQVVLTAHYQNYKQ